MAKFDGTDEQFDSRDALERIAEMELEYGPEDGDSMDTLHLERMTDEERVEYDALKKLEAWSEPNVPDWPYGEQFIHEDYFEEYAGQLVKDVGYIPADLPEWIVIDWSLTADNMKADYEEVEFRGSTYFVRT